MRQFVFICINEQRKLATCYQVGNFSYFHAAIWYVSFQVRVHNHFKFKASIQQSFNVTIVHGNLMLVQAEESSQTEEYQCQDVIQQRLKQKHHL